MRFDPFLIWFSAGSFFLFGMACFTSSAMQADYRRYGLAGFSPLVGTLQLLGAAGLLVGFREPWVGQLAWEARSIPSVIMTLRSDLYSDF